MRVEILGTGGFENSGLPFNAFLINGHILVDAPPDIIQSLGREGIEPGAIDSIILTHYHGDHFFGMPFMLFHYFTHKEEVQGRQIMVAGPAGLHEKLREVLALAIAPDHPYVEWSLQLPLLSEIGAGSRLTWPDGTWMSFRRSAHSVETYSIIAGEQARGEKPLFVSSSDTRWDSVLEQLAGMQPKMFLCDCNGEGTGGVHMSPAEVAVHLLPLLTPGTTTVATHLPCERPEKDQQYPQGRIHFASCGELFEL
ncbi:MAG: MBL fold metallo-hydrolase [Spirochaetaceae bacterium]|nr:MBL fold metallo-hydrolase [Spirochaetaceae bacterium]